MCGKTCPPLRSNDVHFVVLHGLSEGLKGAPTKLRHFVQEKHPVVSKADLSWPGTPPTADESGFADGMMGGAKGWRVDNASLRTKKPSYAMDRGCCERLF
jgi:hypothetical protein